MHYYQKTLKLSIDIMNCQSVKWALSIKKFINLNLLLEYIIMQISLKSFIFDRTILVSISYHKICHNVLKQVFHFKLKYYLEPLELLIRNATRCNNRDDLLLLSFILKISIFSEA